MRVVPGSSVLACLIALAGCAVPHAYEDNPEVLLPRSGRVTAIKSAAVPPKTTHKFAGAAADATDVSVAAATPDVVDPIRIHILNIGAGTCQLVECPSSDDVLVIDCGQIGPSSGDMNEAAIRSYVERVIGSGRSIVALSHPDRDHINRVVKVLGNRRPASIWMGGDVLEYGGNVANWLETMYVAGVEIFVGFDPDYSNRGRPVEKLQCGSAQTYVLTVNTGQTRNSRSLVLLIEFGSFRAIFTGDAEGSTERAAIAHFGALIKDATLLLGSHHGADTHGSNGSEWATAVAPQIVVYSAGTLYGHPKREAVERYRSTLFTSAQHAMRVAESGSDTYQEFETHQAEYVTALSGTIVVESNGTWVWLECSLEPNCF